MFIRFTSLLALLFFSLRLLSQELEIGVPPSFEPAFSQIFQLKRTAPTVEVAAPDLAKIRSEVAADPTDSRFAAAVAVDISTESFGEIFDLPDGRQVWRGEIRSAGAKCLLLIFDKFQIPAGGQFFVFDPSKQFVQGAFTSKSCQADGRMLAGVLPGEVAILEYILPVGGGSAHPDFHLNRIDYGFQVDANVAGSQGACDQNTGFMCSLSCHANINCQAAVNYFREKRGVARMVIVGTAGTGWCTGTLIANTSETPEPYFLTARHCSQLVNTADFSMWRFDFGFEGQGCQNPTSAPSFKSVLGCTKVAEHAQTDILLLKLNPIPKTYDVYFAGWNRSDDPPQYSGYIHHPRGDIKKFSSDATAATIYDQSINWGSFGNSQPNTHFRVTKDVGTWEPGSSGCPLFDHTLRVVGQLHGGIATNQCFPTHTFFGRFSLAWTGSTPTTRLKDWLDPQNKNLMAINGYFPPPINEFDLQGKVLSAWGVPMPNVKVTLADSSGFSKTTTTDADGNYQFLVVQGSKNYFLTAKKDTFDVNGISTNDLLSISRHLLDVTLLDSPWKILASDTNGSNNISTNDIVETRKVLLGLAPNGFTQVPSWKFFPASTHFDNNLNPFPTPTDRLFLLDLDENKINLNFYGIKMGDPNQSSDPKK